MKISGSIKGKKAINVTEVHMRSLCDIILKHCDRLEFSAATKAGTTISFDDINELLNYDNYKPRRLISVEVAGYVGYYRQISVEIGEFTLSPIVNYGRTVRCDYQLPSVDAETIFKNDFEMWYQKVKAPYWLLGKFSINGILFVPSAFVTILHFLFGANAGVNVFDPTVLSGLIVVVIAIGGFVFLIKYIDAYFWGNLFPAVVFNWGEETKRFEKWDRFRSNLMWSIIMATLMGLVTNYIYDILKGL